MALATSKWDNGMPMVDMTGPDHVEVRIDKTQATWRMWVNVNGQCRLRIYGINPKTFDLVENSNG